MSGLLDGLLAEIEIREVGGECAIGVIGGVLVSATIGEAFCGKIET